MSPKEIRNIVVVVCARALDVIEIVRRWSTHFCLAVDDIIARIAFLWVYIQITDGRDIVKHQSFYGRLVILIDVIKF